MMYEAPVQLTVPEDLTVINSTASVYYRIPNYKFKFLFS